MNVVMPVVPAVEGGGSAKVAMAASFAEAHVILALADIAAEKAGSTLKQASSMGKLSKSKVFTDLYPELCKDHRRYKRALNRMCKKLQKRVRRALRKDGNGIKYAKATNVYTVGKFKIKSKQKVAACKAYSRLVHFKPKNSPSMQVEGENETIASQAARLMADYDVLAAYSPKFSARARASKEVLLSAGGAMA